MNEYECNYLTGRTSTAQAVYQAESLGLAMASHNDSRPEFADKVVSWVGPTGIVFQFHDSRLSLSR